MLTSQSCGPEYPTRTSNRGVLSYLEPRGNLLLGGWMLRPPATSRSTAWAWLLNVSSGWAGGSQCRPVRRQGPGSLADPGNMAAGRCWRR